jgi:hypothetical protein
VKKILEKWIADAASWRGPDATDGNGRRIPFASIPHHTLILLAGASAPYSLPRPRNGNFAHASRHAPRPHTGFPMSAHLSRLRLFQRHLRSWFRFGSGFGIGSTLLLTRSFTRTPSSRHPPFTQYPFPPRLLVCGGQTNPHKPRLVVSHSKCPPISSSPQYPRL